ncbi:nucleotide exchange factor GrpE [Methanoregula sp.]|uniref:nucleotide exchange factor GrpE n=1 Tax=Methanoregula sp. TaxID=2052170 RepID=UPI00260AD672|nr:nucleotide exchange factor GrpE [Methanoregula sp.]MDD5141881.1 nucleotide exchange factor GrpE [Methanoregula sp.]
MSNAENGQEPPEQEISDMTAQNAGSPVPGTAEADEQKGAYAELNDRFLRLAADFENFRKRSERERAQTIALANERFACDILEVADNIERALKSDDAHLREGMLQIRQLLSAQLQRHGVCPIESLNTLFDPEVHEAIAHVPSDACTGTVIDEVCRGYRMHDKVIRYAKVAVSKGNENNHKEV